MKKCIAMLLATLMLFGCLLHVSAGELLFINEDDGRYYDILTRLGVFSLYQDEEGFFDGEKGVTRGEAAMALGGLLNLGAGTNSDIGLQFIDVLPDNPASGSIAAMVGMKAMSGFGDNLFRPFDTIEVVHFVKAAMVAFGYQWRAEYAGGYPDGYMKLARETGLIDGVTVANGMPLTRSVLFKLVHNALSVQIYEVVSVSPELTRYETSKESTVLTQYHNIYEETDVVNSNAITSLNDSFTPNEKSILIGNERVFLLDDTSIWNCIGKTVTYYYKQDDAESPKTLFSYVLEGNTTVTLGESDFDSIESNLVEYINAETGKREKLHYSSSTDVIYNGSRDAFNLTDALNNLSGTAEFIDNNDDTVVDVIVINDYIYDEVISVDLSREIIYGESAKYELNETEFFRLDNGLGQELLLEELEAGTVLAIAKSTNGKFVTATVLSSTITGAVKQTGGDTITVNTTAYNVSSGCPADCLAKVKLGSTYTFILNAVNEIVYIKDASADDLKLGYLITYGQTSDAFDSQIFLKVLTNGKVEIFETKEKIQINDTVVESEDIISTLSTLKSHLSLASDGAISQMVRYRVDANNVLTAIYTAKTTENDMLTLKFNSEGESAAVGKYYGVAIVASKEFLGNNSTPIFCVPKTDQDLLDDDYFRISSLDKEVANNNSTSVVETYTVGDDIFPIAVVLYPKTAISGGIIDASAELMMIESLEKVLNTDGASVTKFNLISDGKKLSYLSEDMIDTSDLAVGDTIVLQLNPLNQIQKYAKVYDAGTNQFCIDPDRSVSYEGTTEGRNILKYSLYRRQGDYIKGSSVGFANLDDALDNMYAVDLSRHTTFPMYDSETGEVTIATTDDLVEYARDNENYSNLIIMYYWSTLFSVVLYK